MTAFIKGHRFALFVEAEEKDGRRLNMKYICINCKRGFNELPPKKSNECKEGYFHTFVESKRIIF